MHKLHHIVGPLVHASSVHGGAEHSARQAKNMKNGKKDKKWAHSWWGQIEHMSDVDPSVPQNWYQFRCVQHIFWVSPKPLRIGEWQGRQVSP